MRRYQTPNGTTVEASEPVAASLGLQPLDADTSSAKPATKPEPKRPSRPRKPPAAKS